MQTDNFSTTQKVRYGRQALLEFQNIMVNTYGSDYNLSFDGLIQIVQKNEPDFMEKVGNTLITAGLGQRRLFEAMERVAYKASPSKIPNAYSFNMGIAEELGSFDFSLFGDAALELAKDVSTSIKETTESLGTGAKDLIKGAGSGLSFLGNNFRMFLLAILGVVIIVGFGWLKKKA